MGLFDSDQINNVINRYKDDLSAKPVGMSEAGNNALDESYNRAQATPEEIQKQLLTGVEGRGIPQNELAQSRAALGGIQDQGMLTALKNRGSKQYDRDINLLKHQASFEAPKIQAQRTSAAQNALSQENVHNFQVQQMQFQQRQIEYNRQLAEKQSRSQALGSIFGAAGAIGGGILGGTVGGPAGAVAGASAGGQIGGGAGNMVG